MIQQHEIEVNIFALWLSLNDEKYLDYCERDYYVVALKTETLIAQGKRQKQQSHRNDFFNIYR